MKKSLVIFSLLLLAASCNKPIVQQSGTSSLTQNPTSTVPVIANFTTGNAEITTNIPTTPSQTPTATSSSITDPKVVKKNSHQEVSSPTIVENPVVTPLAQPTQTQQPAVVCNNVSGGSLPAGWYSDGQGNCSATSPQQQAVAAATQQQAAQQQATASAQAQQQATQQAAQSATQAEAVMYQAQYQAIQAKIAPLEAQASQLLATASNQQCSQSEGLGTEGAQCLLAASQGTDVGEYENAIWADFLKPVTTTSIAYENKLDGLEQQIFQIKMNYAQQVAGNFGAGFESQALAEQQIAITAANAKITAINQQIQFTLENYQNGVAP